jgi:hypothetical protein
VAEAVYGIGAIAGVGAGYSKPGQVISVGKGIVTPPVGDQSERITALFLDLEDAEDVRCRVDDPGGPGEADVGDAVFGL